MKRIKRYKFLVIKISHGDVMYIIGNVDKIIITLYGDGW